MSSSSSPLSTPLVSSEDDVARIQEASRAFQQVLEDKLLKRRDVVGNATAGGGSNENRVQNDMEGDGESQRKTASATADSMETVGKEEGKTKSYDDQKKRSAVGSPKHASRTEGDVARSRRSRLIHEVVLEAASDCAHPFVQSFLHTLRQHGRSDVESRLCLLLFAEGDLESKVLNSFDLMTGGNHDLSVDASMMGTDDMRTLFSCFLTAIHMCLVPDDRRDFSSAPVCEPASKVPKEREGASPSSAMVDSNAAPSSLSDPPLLARDLILPDATVDGIHRLASKAVNALAEQTHRGEHQNVRFSVTSFCDWYRSRRVRSEVTDWLELLVVSNWRVRVRSPSRSAPFRKNSESPLDSMMMESHSHQKYARSKPETTSSAGIDLRMTGDIDMESSRVKLETPCRGGVKDEPVDQDLHTSVNLFDDPEKPPSPVPEPTSRTIVSFDFSNAIPSGMPADKDFVTIKITEENLRMLKTLVHRTGVASLPPDHVGNVILRHSSAQQMPASDKHHFHHGDRDSSSQSVMVLRRDDFGRCIRDLVPSEASRTFDRREMEMYSNFFTTFFTCFECCSGGLGSSRVSSRELAVGFSFLCAGNKSTKLAAAFELLDEKHRGYLTHSNLTLYLRSYLTMLVGISLLTSSSSATAEIRNSLLSRKRHDLFLAVDSGAKWTQGHFRKTTSGRTKRTGEVTFDDFAEWYTEGGYTVAPWLELLDLSKFLSLLQESKQEYDDGRKATSERRLRQSSATMRDRSSSLSEKPERSHSTSSASPTDILFTFPLANHQSLVVLREDATYVRSVVHQLGLVSLTSEDVWSALFEHTRSYPPAPPRIHGRPQRRRTTGKNMEVDQSTFVRGMEHVIYVSQHGKSSSSASASTSIRETLKNFFQSFDLDEVDSVALNQLMGGLTLLCDGKKSSKLAFSFGLFDSRKEDKRRKDHGRSFNPSLSGEDMFVFFRSFLIVMFSCCKQSLDLSADAVGRHISDTAHAVSDDVMRYQWHRKRRDRVDFDDFGEWYNEGGFETAPWLELLDLNKWVLVGDPPEGADPPHSRHSPKQAATKEEMPSVPDTSTDRSGVSLQVGGARNDRDMHADLAETHRQPQSEKRKARPPPLPPTEQSPKKSAHQPEDCPPAPPDDALDPTSPTNPFFGDDDHAIMPSESMDGVMDDIDFMLQQETHDKENEGNFSANTSAEATSHRPAGSERPAHESTTNDHRPEGNRGEIAPSSSLKFHLVTEEEHGGYIVFISQRRLRLLRSVIVDSALCKQDVASVCQRLLEAARSPHQLTREDQDPAAEGRFLSKATYDSTMRHLLHTSCGGKSRLSREVQRDFFDLTDNIFNAFDTHYSGSVDALDISCGLTVLCGGRKSDKLEHAFELLDEDKDGKLSRRAMVRFLKSFLTVLLSVAIGPLESTNDDDEVTLTTVRGDRCGTDKGVLRVAIDEGSNWATREVFASYAGDINKREKSPQSKSTDRLVSFDEFADWYTKGGYTSIPWLELLDLRKWVLVDVVT